MPDLALPPTSAFPPDPSELKRAELDRIYLQLRTHDKSLMLSRGHDRGRAHRQDEQIREQSLQQFQQSEEMAQLRERLNQVLARESQLKAETDAMLEAVSEVMEHLEDAGDALSRWLRCRSAWQAQAWRRPQWWCFRPRRTAGWWRCHASADEGVLHFL